MKDQPLSLQGVNPLEVESITAKRIVPNRTHWLVSILTQPKSFNRIGCYVQWIYRPKEPASMVTESFGS